MTSYYNEILEKSLIFLTFDEFCGQANNKESICLICSDDHITIGQLCSAIAPKKIEYLFIYGLDADMVEDEIDLCIEEKVDYHVSTLSFPQGEEDDLASTMISMLFINREIETLYVVDSETNSFDIIYDYILDSCNQNMIDRKEES